MRALTLSSQADWDLYNGAVAKAVDIVHEDGLRPTDDPAPLLVHYWFWVLVLGKFPGYSGPPYMNEDLTVV